MPATFRSLMLRTALPALAALSVAACGREPGRAPNSAAVKGERLVLQTTSIPELKPVAATVTTRDMADARARIQGVLTRLTVKEGDIVRKGQVIGFVSDARIGLETRAYDAQVAAAQAENVRAQAELSRTQDLYDHGVYARARLDQVQASARAAQGALDAARAQRAASAEGGAQGAILAPASGRVLRADTPQGSVVTPGQSVAQVTAGPTVLRVEIPEADAQGLKAGDTIAIASEDLSGAASARVEQVYPAVAAGRVVADLSAPGLKGDLVGRRVRVRMALGLRQGLVVPQRFVVTRSGVDYVRVLSRGGSVEEAPVQLAPGPAAGVVEALSGLAPGDVLVAPERAQ